MTALLTLLAASPAAWALPDRVAATLSEASSTSVERLLTFEDHDVAVIVAGDNTLRLIDTDTWESEALAPCDSPTSVTGYTDSTTGYLELVVGCSAGSVQTVSVASDHSVTLGTETDLGYGAIKDLVAYSEDALWIAVEGIDLYQLDMDDYSEGVSSTLNQSGLVELAKVGGYVIAAHSSLVSQIDPSTGNYTTPTSNVGSRSYTDMAIYGSSGVFLADGNQGGVIRYQLSAATNQDYQTLLSGGELTGVSALAIDVSDSDDPWMALADDSQTVYFYTFVESTPTVETTVIESIDVSEQGGLSKLAALDGYLIGGSDAGEVVVLTERPWVTVTSSSGSSTVSSGDTVTLSISTDTGGQWSLRQGGYNGDEVASGSFDAEELAEVELSIDSSFEEGRNRMVVRVEDGFLEGRGGATLYVDNPPPVVDNYELGVGREKLIVSFDGVDVADLDHYEVYISTVAFSADDYDEGGPAFVGSDDVSSPITLSGYSAGEDVSTTISGLTNGQTYYVGVRAVDTNGTEGSMSDVLSASPTDAVGAAGLAGDEGGIGCSTGPGPGSAAGLLTLAAAALLGRRRRLTGLLGLGLAALVATPAHAEDDGRVKGHRDDDGKVVFDRTGELRFGGTSLSDGNIQTVYGSSAIRSLDLEMGVQMFRVLEFDAGLGLVRGTGNLIGVDTGTAIDEEGKLTLVPLSLAATLRLDLFDGMPIVPYGSFGLDYWLWRERLGDIDVADLFQQDTVMGDKVGYHYALGANVLLDWADPKHASLARARWGIHDTYLTMDVSWNRMLEEGGLSFDSRAITVGLKFDH
ncbi:MAG: hypothetical protein H6741_07450 [Alphaproteobacteria bacterium]|nr:hypothetical protein [Alphaproteobacteria bacterium]MCB9792550.1 hypothetical protein [Alphaproteobacteria bacterium]